jgi:hypothetical protein
MDYFAGLDVSVKETSVCIVDDAGAIARAGGKHPRRDAGDNAQGRGAQRIEQGVDFFVIAYASRALRVSCLGIISGVYEACVPLSFPTRRREAF